MMIIPSWPAMMRSSISFGMLDTEANNVAAAAQKETRLIPNSAATSMGHARMPSATTQVILSSQSDEDALTCSISSFHFPLA
ncbi:hypothetical protein ACOSP7_031788 [Xanthoceras sorbifolium]